MKLEFDLLRDLLAHIETAADRPYSEIENIELEGWNADQIAYHVIRAEEAGLIKAHIDTMPDCEDPSVLNVIYIVNSLTFKGHEFIGAVRNDDIWGQVKGGARKAGSMTVGVLASLAEAALKRKIENWSVDLAAFAEERG